MAIKNKDDLLTRINSLIPEGAEDLTILEDISDTFDDLQGKAQTDWESKYNTLYEAYRTRFVEGEPGTTFEEVIEDEPAGPTRFEDLFEEDEI